MRREVDAPDSESARWVWPLAFGADRDQGGRWPWCTGSGLHLTLESCGTADGEH